ncbi:hypothetical protein [Kitasatospora sp. NPDC002965]|uniref:hypothetical protein n=1 Tax=unclassified Kitasatospora TaxID=2633591 RepID=UPI00339E0889
MQTTTSATKRTGLVAALVLFLSLMGFGGQATAAPAVLAPHFALSVDHATVTPGQVANLTVTFTNPQTTAVQFLYLWLPMVEVGPQPATGARAEFVGCTGDVSLCDYQSSRVILNLTSPQVPIDPGTSRTITLSFRYPATSDCTVHPVVDFAPHYFHYEYALGTLSHDGAEVPTPAVTSTLVCPPTV